MNIKPIKHFEVEELLEFDRQANAYIDPDFDKEVWPNAITEAELMEMISRPDDNPETFKTRTYSIAEGCTLLGGFVIEVLPQSYDVLWFTFDRTHPNSISAFDEMLEFLQEKAETSKTRRAVNIYLADRNESGMKVLIPRLQHYGFTISLQRDWFNDCDGWKCEFVAETLLPS